MAKKKAAVKAATKNAESAAGKKKAGKQQARRSLPYKGKKFGPRATVGVNVLGWGETNESTLTLKVIKVKLTTFQPAGPGPTVCPKDFDYPNGLYIDSNQTEYQYKVKKLPQGNSAADELIVEVDLTKPRRSISKDGVLVGEELVVTVTTSKVKTLGPSVKRKK
jgi:hypothetical protein